MLIDVFTLFPGAMSPYLDSSVLGKARDSGVISVRLHDIRDYATDRHRTTDTEPYGGGGGMVMAAGPLFEAVEDILGEAANDTPIILMTPQGRVFNQSVAAELAAQKRIALISGRYEGVDERVRQHLVTDEISIGDYVLTGGELPALVVIDAVARLISGVLGDAHATMKDSHSDGLLEGPHFTRPAEYRGWKVPEVLMSGDHAKIAAWRRQESLRRTLERRPELLVDEELTDHDLEILDQLRRDQEAEE